VGLKKVLTMLNEEYRKLLIFPISGFTHEEIAKMGIRWDCETKLEQQLVN
jgi:hypothetical protein